MKPKIMQCGHAPNAQTQDDKWVCAICIGIHPGATIPAEELPDLTGRKARCSCGKEKESSFNLPFFEHKPKQAYDFYYCGHKGWE